MSLRRAVLVGAIACALVVIGAGPAAAHAELETSDPASGAVLDPAPEAVTLGFSEEVELALGGIRLFAADGAQVDIGAPEHVPGDASSVRAGLPELGDGSYVVAWSVISADSHPVRGAFTFQIGEGSGADTRQLVADLLSGSGDNGAAKTALTVARFIGYAGLALLVGGLVFVAFVAAEVGAQARLRRLLAVGGGLAAIGAFAAFALQGPYATGQSVAKAFDPDLWDGVADTRFGRATLARAVLVGLGGSVLVFTVAHRRTFAWRAGVAALVPAAAFTVAMAGHAGVERLPVLGVAADMAHVGAMCVWLGGLAVAGFVLLREAPTAAAARSVGAASATDAATSSEDVPAATIGVDAARTMARFSTVAAVAVGLLVGSGLVQAWRLVGSLDALVDTNYGRTLLIKTAVVAAMVTAAWFSRRALARRDGRTLRQSVRDELAFGAGVLVVTAILVGTAPARVVASEPFSVSVVKDDLIADITVDPAVAGRPIGMHIYVTPPGGSLQRLEGLQVRWTLPERDLGPLETRVDTAGPNHWVASGFELPIGGDWELELIVRVSTFEQERLTTTVPIE